MSLIVEELRWKKFPVLSDGFITLVDVMGDDSSVAQAARVSYGKDKREGQDDSPASIRKLIRYLMSHRHSTPFEMAEVKLLVRVPMDTWRQWIRHRTANVNEYSTRYTTAIDSMDKTPPEGWRVQSVTNKQGSEIGELKFPEGMNTQVLKSGVKNGPNQFLSNRERDFHETAKRLYQERIECGVAREQARKDLPLSNYTEAYWKCDLHNVLGFLALRMDSHAQKEIRDYANIIGNEIIAKLFPVTWEAFRDYRLNAMALSGPEIKSIRYGGGSNHGLTEREVSSLHAKLERMGLKALIDTIS